MNDLDINKSNVNYISNIQANNLINNLNNLEVSNSIYNNNHQTSSIVKDLSETGIESLEGYFRIIRIRNKELEQKLNYKEQEYKRIESSLSDKEVLMVKIKEDNNKLSDSLNIIENNYLKQMAIKDQIIEEKTKEISNLLNKLFDKQAANNKISNNTESISYNKNLLSNNFCNK